MGRNHRTIAGNTVDSYLSYASITYSKNFCIYFFAGCEMVQHGEDGKYMWIIGGDDIVYDKQSQADRTTSERLMTLLTNFVKYL